MLTVAPADVVRRLAEDPALLVEQVSKEHHVTPRAVVEALPAAMRAVAPGEAFVDVMGEVATWGDLTLIIHSDDGVMEFTGPIPPGKVSGDYYHLSGRTGFHGHLRHKRCAGIAFVERPFMSRPTASLLFFNDEGGISFKIFIGRDESGQLKPAQMAGFRALAARLTGAAAAA